WLRLHWKAGHWPDCRSRTVRPARHSAPRRGPRRQFRAPTNRVSAARSKRGSRSPLAEPRLPDRSLGESSDVRSTLRKVRPGYRIQSAVFPIGLVPLAVRSRCQPAEQIAQRLGVGIERRAAAASQGYRGQRRDPVAGLRGTDVASVLELSKMRDQVAGRQLEHVLKAGEGKRVALVQGGQGDEDA